MWGASAHEGFSTGVGASSRRDSAPRSYWRSIWLALTTAGLAAVDVQAGSEGGGSFGVAGVLVLWPNGQLCGRVAPAWVAQTSSAFSLKAALWLSRWRYRRLCHAFGRLSAAARSLGEIPSSEP